MPTSTRLSPPNWTMDVNNTQSGLDFAANRQGIYRGEDGKYYMSGDVASATNDPRVSQTAPGFLGIPTSTSHSEKLAQWDQLRYGDAALNEVLGIPEAQLDNVAAQQQGQSEMANVRADPAARAAQQQALTALMQRGNDGYGIEDRAAVNNAMNEANQQVRGQNAAAMQQMQARGQGNSGFAMAAQLANNQGMANAAANAGMNAAAQSRQRALQSLMAGGQMAGQIRGQSFDEGAKRASAQDEINARNVALRQQTGLYNSGLQQQRWQDQMARRQARAGAYGAASDAAQRRIDTETGQQTAANQSQAQTAETAAKIAAAIYGWYK